ncbi:CG0192-related protein [Actinoplanes sp. G11-F43]|uniref:CG0192-related protein n=1 Tax=Actinoplanes sp. G11-F43 TaxID=3424130 RepID=UPI003D33F58C
MALLHKATIVPSKIELLNRWLPSRPWSGGADGFERVAAGRFDDPAGAVGIETLIVRAADGRLLHVPLTYRGEPLAGAEAWLVGVTEHSVLGTRWVYDAVGDPVYVAQAVETIRSAGREAVEEFEVDGEMVARVPDLALRGSGLASGITGGTTPGVASGAAFGVTPGVASGVTGGGTPGVAEEATSGVISGSAPGRVSGSVSGVAAESVSSRPVVTSGDLAVVTDGDPVGSWSMAGS